MTTDELLASVEQHFEARAKSIEDKHGQQQRMRAKMRFRLDNIKSAMTSLDFVITDRARVLDEAKQAQAPKEPDLPPVTKTKPGNKRKK